MNADMNFILDDAQGYVFSTYVKAFGYAKVKYRNNKNIEIIDESPVSESSFLKSRKHTQLRKMYIAARLCYNIHVWPLSLFYPPRIVKKMSIIFYDEEV